MFGGLARTSAMRRNAKERATVRAAPAFHVKVPALPALVLDALAAGAKGLANYPTTAGPPVLREAIAAWLRDRGETHDSSFVTGFAERIDGQVLSTGGDLASAERSLELSLKAMETDDVPFEIARSKLLLGEVRRRSGHKRLARQDLLRARSIFVGLGASRWVAEVDQALGRITGRRPSMGKLTDAELRVARLASAGFRNREIADQLFMSVRTVEGHVDRILTKLGLRSRTEAAVYAASLETLTPAQASPAPARAVRGEHLRVASRDRRHVVHGVPGGHLTRLAECLRVIAFWLPIFLFGDERTAEVVHDYVNIRSRSGGYVVKRLVAPGVLVQPGMAILKVAQIDRVRLQANVGEKDLASIKIGSPVNVKPAGTGQAPTTARVTSVFPFVDQGARTGVVEAIVDNAARRLLPGQYVQMEFVTGEQPRALTVPRAAIVRMGGKARVWVVDGDRAQPRQCRCARASGPVLARCRGGGGAGE